MSLGEFNSRSVEDDLGRLLKPEASSSNTTATTIRTPIALPIVDTGPDYALSVCSAALTTGRPSIVERTHRVSVSP
jgi:hypothetical protein